MPIDVVTWCEANVVLDAGNLIRFEPHQKKKLRRMFKMDKDGRLRYGTMLDGEPKKSGKTEELACVGQWAVFELDPTGGEVICVANDEEQAVGRVFKAIRRSVEKNPVLMSRVASITRTEITLKDGGTIRAIASEYAGAAGANPTCTLWDELWAYRSERSIRLWEELTQSPARKNSFRMIGTYAGFPDESGLLEGLYRKGLAGRRLLTLLPLWENGDLIMWWSHTPRMPWQTPEYYRQQQAELRPGTFARLHRNEWTSGEQTFLTRELVDAAIRPGVEAHVGSPEHLYYLSLDLGLRRDRTASAVVHREEDGTIVCDRLEVFEAPKHSELIIEDIEEHILDLGRRFELAKIIFDPWQSVRTRQRLEGEGYDVAEFIFSGANWTRMTELLWSLFRDRRIRIPAHPTLIRELLSVKSVEKSYGVRLDHSPKAHDDCVVALGMACFHAVRDEGFEIRITDLWTPSDVNALARRRVHDSAFIRPPAEGLRFDRRER